MPYTRQGPFGIQSILFGNLNLNSSLNLTLDIIPVSIIIDIMTRITDRFYLYIHSNDYEYKYKLHLDHSKCSLNYIKSSEILESCGQNLDPKALFRRALRYLKASLKYPRTMEYRGQGYMKLSIGFGVECVSQKRKNHNIYIGCM